MKIVFLTCFVWLSIINCDARGSLRRCSLLSYTCVSDHYQIGSDALITRISSKEECAEKCCNNHLCVGFDYFGKPWQQCQLSYSTRKEVPLTSYSLTGSVIIQCQKKAKITAMRCNGQDEGCCTDSTPCDLGEGDCDKNSHCAGSLICGTDNCPWGDGDDCCMKKPTGGASYQIGDDGKFYKLYTERKSWFEAQIQCQLDDANLAIENDANSHNYIKRKFGGEEMWIGGTDHGHEGRWTWVNGRAVEQTYWETTHHEPNGGTNENCMNTNQNGDGNWNDGVCETKLIFLCQKVDGGYSDWSSYSECSVSCGGGTKSRNRTCTKPTPAHDGNDCSKLGNSSETKSCNTQPCPVDGGYSDWSSYSECSVSCGAGTKSRNRSCTKPTPAHDGNNCSKLGKSLETTSCNTQPCPGTVKCGSDINADVGILTSPNYPKNYGNNENCTTYITVSKGHVIKIVIEELDIEKSNDCMFDYLEISDGMDRVMGKYCGKRYNIRLTSKSNGVQIKFKSDTSVVKAGFLLKWNAYSDLPQKMLGVYTMTYGSPHEYTYTVTRNRVFASCCCGYSWLIRQSDQSNVFPTRDGWFKGVGINWRENYYFYFRLTKQGTLELHYFKKGYTAKYKSLPNYYGKPGKGIKRDYLKKTLGAYITSFGNKEFKFKYTVQRDRLFFGKECCYFVWMIVQSDQQVRFPSYAGWFKGVGANNRKDYYMYFRLNDKDQLEIQYFKPGLKYEYNGLPNYYGSTGIGKRI